MRKLSLRILVALIALIISVSSSWLLHRLRQPKVASVQPAPCAAPTPSDAPQCVPISYEEDDAEYPDESGLSPSEISWFIDHHPRTKLDKLWARLHIKDGQALHSEFSKCGHCSTSVDYYDLDEEAGEEALLKVSDALNESYRYLVFKRVGDTDYWRLIGHVDEWGKYKDSQSYVVVSGGRPWLVTQGQSASGSGVAFYHNRVLAVTNRGLMEVASYECEGYQSGIAEWPTREFSTRILDVQSYVGQTRVKVEFNLNYSLWAEGNRRPLFSKRQVALFISSSSSGPRLYETDSTVTQRELDHIYQVDAMTEHDFLKYNLSELLTLAARGNRAQKTWLHSFLKACDNSGEKQRLLAALAN